MIEEKVRKLIALRTAHKRMADLARSTFRHYFGMLSQMLPGVLTQAEISEASDELSEQIGKADLEQTIIERMVPIWCEHFSEEEIDAMIAFYESAIGQKIMRTEMEIKEKETQITMSVAKKFLDDFLKEKGKEL